MSKIKVSIERDGLLLQMHDYQIEPVAVWRLLQLYETFPECFEPSLREAGAKWNARRTVQIASHFETRIMRE